MPSRHEMCEQIAQLKTKGAKPELCMFEVVQKIEKFCDERGALCSVTVDSKGLKVKVIRGETRDFMLTQTELKYSRLSIWQTIEIKLKNLFK